MQPYQQANEELRRRGETPLRIAETAGKLVAPTTASALAYGGGTALFKRILPLLSQYVPEDFAKKGLEKINPGFGKFIDKAESEGYDFNEIKDFIKEKGEKTEERENPKENRNIIEQYSPDLNKFIADQIAGGRKPIEAAAIAQHDKRFSEVIKKMIKDHKTSWSSIIESIFGSGQNAQPIQSTNQQQQQTQEQPQQGQVGPGQASLMEILNKINQRLGK